MDKPDAYKHLSKEAKPLADLPDADRIAFIRSDHFIEHPYIPPILNEVHRLMTSTSKRTAGVAVMGFPNSGKTQLIEHIYQTWEAEDDKSRPHPVRRIVRISMSAADRAQKIYERIFDAVDAPDCSGSESWRSEEQAAIRLLIHLKCRLLLLDEFSDLLSCHSMEQRKVISAVKLLMNEAHVCVGAFGTQDMGGVFNIDQHMSARFKRFQLERWTVDGSLQVLLKAVQKALPLRKPSSLLAVGAMQALIDGSDGILGGMMRLIQDAASVAILEHQEFVDEALLRQVIKTPPDYSRFP